VIILDDESDIEIDEESNNNVHEKDDDSILKDLIGQLEINTEIIVVKPNLLIRICTTAVAYPNLQDTHVIRVILHTQKKNYFFCETRSKRSAEVYGG
jgi:hypothetical protein